ncbi:MAG TPA: kelch repeat-containing protein [Acidimicrobiales bacterium]|nr:kelch repeat-containing protein [Acidimicrobiales bacterium]
MRGLSGRSTSSSAARNLAHGSNRKGLRLVLFGGLIVAALALAACQPHGAVLQGRITDTSAGRLAGVQVRMYSSATESVVASTRTDRDGDWSFMPAALADGTYRILFSDDSWWQGATGWADATDVAVAAGSTRVIDATIDAAKGSVAGTVTDGTDPIAGVQVSARMVLGNKVVAKAVTAGDGTYAFDGLAAGDYRFEFSHSGYTTRYSDGATSPATAPIVTVGDGDSVAGIDTTLVSEASISGTLSDGTAPVDHGLVVVYDLTHERWVDLVFTSADGRFDLASLNPGQYVVGFVDGSDDSVTFYGTTDDDPAQGAPITVPLGGSVDLGMLVWGTALYPPTAPTTVTAGEGDAQATVSWDPPATDGGSPITGYTVTASPGGATCTTTGAATCVVDGLTNGTSYTFTATATNTIGIGPASTSSPPVTPAVSAQWQQVMPAIYNAPETRATSGVAPLGNGRTVLYGGSLDGSTAAGDTWIWAGDAWTELHPTTTPGPLLGVSMAALPGGRAVLFGGTADPAGAPSGATWIFDGTTWHLQNLSTAPAPRSAAVMTALSNGDVLLFGGVGADSAVLTDTWIFDGLAWTELDPGTVPPGRVLPALAALPDGEAVLYGGFTSANGVMGDTWIFDGTTWHEVESATVPPGRAGAAMAPLPDGNVVLFGGADPDSGSFFDDTWIFDGTEWTARAPSTVPPARYGAAAATVTDDGVLMFGGIDFTDSGSPGDSTLPNDTWLYDGTNWTRHGVVAALPPTMAGSVVALSGDDVLLFGGADSPSYDTVYDSTWLFDGTIWTLLHPATSPPPRAGASMVKLPDGKVLLYGGFTPDHGAFDDTWIFDGSNWSEQSPDTSPPGLAYGSLVAMPDGTVVYFGGTDILSATVTDGTWVWDGSTWTEQSPAASPPARMGATMSVGADGHAVLFGGFDQETSTVLDDTWEWDGTTWAELSTSVAPPGRLLASMVTLDDGTILLLGGANATLTESFGDVWFFDGTTWTQDPSSDVPPARAAASMVTRSDGAVVLIGGVDLATVTALNDIWIRQ